MITPITLSNLFQKTVLQLKEYRVFIHEDRITDNTRQAEYVLARAIIAHELRKRGYFLEYIGDALGGRTHATVINLLKYDEGKSKKRLREIFFKIKNNR